MNQIVIFKIILLLIDDVRQILEYLRDKQNLPEFFDECKRPFRFNKNSVFFGILLKIHEGLTPISNRDLPITPELQ